MKPLLDVDQVAHLLHVSRRKLEKLLTRSQAPMYFLVGRERRWRALDVQEWVRSRAGSTQQEPCNPGRGTGVDMTPTKAGAPSLRSHGRRDFILRTYDDQFIALTCPEVHRGDALVTPRGIKIKYLWFNALALQKPGVLGTRVPVRYDPCNSGLGYAYVNQRWVTVQSERDEFVSTLTEQAVRFAQAAMRLTGRKRGEKAQINAQNLARFLSTTEGEEEARSNNRSCGYSQNDLDRAAQKPYAKPRR
jgi:excisionase family DNA binding protein